MHINQYYQSRAQVPLEVQQALQIQEAPAENVNQGRALRCTVKAGIRNCVKVYSAA